MSRTTLNASFSLAERVENVAFPSQCSLSLWSLAWVIWCVLALDATTVRGACQLCQCTYCSSASEHGGSCTSLEAFERSFLPGAICLKSWGSFGREGGTMSPSLPYATSFSSFALSQQERERTHTTQDVSHSSFCDDSPPRVQNQSLAMSITLEKRHQPQATGGAHVEQPLKSR